MLRIKSILSRRLGHLLMTGQLELKSMIHSMYFQTIQFFLKSTIHFCIRCVYERIEFLIAYTLILLKIMAATLWASMPGAFDLKEVFK